MLQVMSLRRHLFFNPFLHFCALLSTQTCIGLNLVARCVLFDHYETFISRISLIMAENCIARRREEMVWHHSVLCQYGVGAHSFSSVGANFKSFLKNPSFTQFLVPSYVVNDSVWLVYTTQLRLAALIELDNCLIIKKSCRLRSDGIHKQQ